MTYLREAGEKAAARSAYREAATAFEQALVALGHLPESRGTIEQSVDLRQALRLVLQPLHDVHRILMHLQPAEGLAEQLGDPARLGRVLSGLCNTWWTRGDHDRAVALGTRALEIGDALGDVALRPEAMIRLGAVHYTLGNHSTAVGSLRQSLDLMRARPESERLGMVGLASVMANIWLSRALSELGQFAAAKARADEGLRVATSADQPFSLIAAHLALGILGLHQGHFDRAAAAFRSALDLGRTWDIPGFPESDGGLACALALQGEREDAIRVLEEATRAVHRTGAALLLSGRAAWLGEAARRCGRPQEAEKFAEEALRLAHAHKERGNEAWALRFLGDLASDREPLSCCRDMLRRRPRPGRDARDAPAPAHCLRGLGLLHRRTGARQVARQELAVARELYQDMGMTFWLERSENALIELR